MKAKTFAAGLLALFLLLAVWAGTVPARAVEDFNLNSSFWEVQGDVTQNNALKVTMGNADGYIAVDENLTGDYSVEFTIQYLNDWVYENGAWSNPSDGAFFFTLGAKKRGDQFMEIVSDRGAGGLSMRITDSMIHSPIYIGGTYPYYSPDGTSLGDGFSHWFPAGDYMRKYDLPVRYKFEVNREAGRVLLYADLLTEGADHSEYTQCGYISLAEWDKVEGYPMFSLSSVSSLDDIVVRGSDGAVIFEENFDDGVVSEKLVTDLSSSAMEIINTSAVMNGDAQLTSTFTLERRVQEGDTLLDAVFYAQGSEGSSLLLTVGTAELTLSEGSLSLSENGTPVTTVQDASLSLESGVWLGIEADRYGMLTVSRILRSQTLPVEYADRQEVFSEELQPSSLEGKMQFRTGAGSDQVEIADFAINGGIFDAQPEITGVIIDDGNLSYIRQTGGVLSLTAEVELTPALDRHSGVIWQVVSGPGTITDREGNADPQGSYLRIDGYGTISVRAVSAYDTSISQTVDVAAVRIEQVNISAEKIGSGEYRLTADVISTPLAEEFGGVEWQVIEGDAEISDDGMLHIGDKGRRVVVKAISEYNPAVSAEYVVFTPMSAGTIVCIVLSAVFGALIVAAAVLLILNLRKRSGKGERKE